MVPLFSRQGFITITTALNAFLAGGALTADIRADTNRDGIVDLEGDTDVAGKAIWSASRGAIFLPNIGDSFHRCPGTDLNGDPLSNEELAACSDGSGHLLLRPEYVAPLRAVPMPELSSNAYANVYATPDAAYDRVRLFVNDNPSNASPKAWRLVDKEFTFNATQLHAGLVLGLDSRELVEDGTIWDGNVIIRFDVTDGHQSASDAVALKLAPVLTHHHLQRVDTLLTVAANETNPAQLDFISQLDKSRELANIQDPLLLLDRSDDIWAQDFLEPAYSSMPGPNGPISIRVILRSAQSTRVAGRQVFELLRGKGVGGFQPRSRSGGFGHTEINSFGNLETIPPYTSKSGVAYRAGRIITGKHFGTLPAEPMLNFLDSQEVQRPLILETGWLLIGHVDEFVQFLPFDNKLGWTIAIADTTSGMELLEAAQAAGHGGLRATSFDPGRVPDNYGAHNPKDLALTINDLLTNQTFRDVNRYAQRHIDANLQILLSEVNILVEQIIRVPTLFQTSNFEIPRENGLPPRITPVLPGEFQVMSFYPASINGIVVGKRYLSPKPWGPVVDGVDILEKAVESAYTRAGMTVDYVDDYLSHHVWLGEIHCGSNTLRQTDIEWWE